MTVTDLYPEKLKRMTEGELLSECEMHGRVMERGSMTQIQKVRAYQCFTYAAKHPKLEDMHELFKTALKVLRIL